MHVCLIEVKKVEFNHVAGKPESCNGDKLHELIEEHILKFLCFELRQLHIRIVHYFVCLASAAHILRLGRHGITLKSYFMDDAFYSED